MAAAFDPTDPAHLTPQQRTDELADLLAMGLRRLMLLRQRTADSPSPHNPSESSQKSLDGSAESRLDGARGVNANAEPTRS